MTDDFGDAESADLFGDQAGALFDCA